MLSKERTGIFTASAFHKLMGKKGLGLTGEGYALEKAIEKVFGTDDSYNFTSFDMNRGIELEPTAFEFIQAKLGAEFIKVETCGFFKYDDDLGATPDGLVGDDAILEIKCPRPEKLFKLISGKQAIDEEYIIQMQIQMMCTGRNKAYFFNFAIWNNEPVHHLIIIERDEEMINKILERKAEAVILREEYAQYLVNNKQF